MGAKGNVDFSNACHHVEEDMRQEHVTRPAHGCPECLAMGSRWVHLRVCLTCGHVGCCDDSPNRHATAHHGATKHPIITSGEAGEDWAYCYADDQFLSAS